MSPLVYDTVTGSLIYDPQQGGALVYWADPPEEPDDGWRDVTVSNYDSVYHKSSRVLQSYNSSAPVPYAAAYAIAFDELKNSPTAVNGYAQTRIESYRAVLLGATWRYILELWSASFLGRTLPTDEQSGTFDKVRYSLEFYSPDGMANRPVDLYLHTNRATIPTSWNDRTSGAKVTTGSAAGAEIEVAVSDTNFSGGIVAFTNTFANYYPPDHPHLSTRTLEARAIITAIRLKL